MLHRLPFFPAITTLLLFSATPGVVIANAEQPQLNRGVDCDKTRDAEDGATHLCYFDPTVRDRFDFSSRNGRAGYVVSELGPYCDELDILADQDHLHQGQPSGLRVVRVQCLR